jgi:hypothetical protein
MNDPTKKPERQRKTKPKQPEAPAQKAPPNQTAAPNNEERYEDAEGSWGDLRPPSDS